MKIDNATIPRFIDAHAHLELEPLFRDYEGVVTRARQAGLAAIVTVGIDLEDATRAMQIAHQYDDVFACMGYHPHNAKYAGALELAQMQDMASDTKVVGYGEIGLDFFRNHSPRDIQISIFDEQIRIARTLKKPVVIHLRDAYDKGLSMLEKSAPFPSAGVIHCFSGNEDDARRALDLGLYISIPGTVTYKNNHQLRSIVEKIPDDRILLETDCPFLAPEPLRGKDNEPAFIVHTAKKVAEVRGTTLENIGKTSTGNACVLFRLPRHIAGQSQTA